MATCAASRREAVLLDYAFLLVQPLWCARRLPCSTSGCILHCAWHHCRPSARPRLPASRRAAVPTPILPLCLPLRLLPAAS